MPAIPNDSGLQVLAYFLDKRPVLEPPTSKLTRLAELALTFNMFSFNQQYYHQVDRVAMGSQRDPNLTYLQVGYKEERISLARLYRVHSSTLQAVH